MSQEERPITSLLKLVDDDVMSIIGQYRNALNECEAIHSTLVQETDSDLKGLFESELMMLESRLSALSDNVFIAMLNCANESVESVNLEIRPGIPYSNQHLQLFRYRWCRSSLICRRAV